MYNLLFVLLVVQLTSLAAEFTCPATPITAVTLGGNLPFGATNITAIPAGTNCTFSFDIPHNYALLLKFSVDFQSTDDTVQIIDNRLATRNLLHTGSIVYDAPLWVSARSAKVIVIGRSGNSRFMMSYMYQALNDFKQVAKKTGEPVPLSSIENKSYLTITTSANGEKVVVNPGKRAGSQPDIRLQEYYVYDGDNINTANMIGTLDDFNTKIIPSSGNSYTVVNFYGTVSASYVLGNDASTLSGFSYYLVGITTLGSSLTGTLKDLTASDNGIAYTVICIDCSTFYWTTMSFDSFGTISNKGYITFQGQTPTHKREKLIKYDAMMFTDDQLPQMLPTNIFTMNVYLSIIDYNFNTINDDTAWKKPYIGRKGYIFSPNLWGSLANNFNYEFRDDSQLYNFTMNINKMSFPASSDRMTLKIGSGTGSPTVNNTYPSDQSSNNKVMANGNYIQVGLVASVGADVRLSFEMQKAKSASALGVMAAVVLTLFSRV